MANTLSEEAMNSLAVDAGNAGGGRKNSSRRGERKNSARGGQGGGDGRQNSARGGDGRNSARGQGKRG